MKNTKIVKALKFAAELSRARSVICYTGKTHKHPHCTDLITLATYSDGGKKKVMFIKLYEDGSFELDMGD